MGVRRSTSPASTGPSARSVVASRPWRRWILRAGLALLVVFGLIQLIPFGRAGNPPVTRAAVWPLGAGQALAEGACFDCHSNLTKRWWATKVAPVSWLAQNDVSGGRDHLNFSRWDTPQPDLDQVIEAVRSGSMPPLQYKLVHGNARLGAAERAQLADALTRLYASDPPAGVRSGGG